MITDKMLGKRSNILFTLINIPCANIYVSIRDSWNVGIS